MAPTTMLELPTEILNHILHHAIPVTRLARHAILDAEWKKNCAEPRSVPPLLFVNKKLSQQAGNVFYSKAILEITPVKLPSYILNALDAPDVSLDLAVSLDVVFAPISRQLLARIRKVFIYSGQRDAVSAEGYEATLRWLLEKTDVKAIYLSQRLMTRLRKFRVDVDSAINIMHHSGERETARIMEVYATQDRSYWERIRIKELTKAMQGNSPPLYQYFLSWPGGPLLLDPRWDARNSDDDNVRQKRDEIAEFLDQLAAGRPLPSQLQNDPALLIPSNESCWLYQICFVVAT